MTSLLELLRLWRLELKMLAWRIIARAIEMHEHAGDFKEW
jgi:hypothetical protein